MIDVLPDCKGGLVEMDFPRFRLLGTRLRTAVVRLGLTDVLLFLLLLLFARHEWANRTPAGRYVKYPFGSGEVVLLDTSTGTLYGIDKDGAWRRNLVRAAIAADKRPFRVIGCRLIPAFNMALTLLSRFDARTIACAGTQGCRCRFTARARSSSCAA